MSESYIIKIDTTLQVNPGDYLIITTEGARAKYKHLPADLAKVIQTDAVKHKVARRLAGPKAVGSVSQQFNDELLKLLKGKWITGEQVLKALPKYRTGQVFSRLSKLAKEGKLITKPSANGRARVYSAP